MTIDPKPKARVYTYATLTSSRPTMPLLGPMPAVSSILLAAVPPVAYYYLFYHHLPRTTYLPCFEPEPSTWYGYASNAGLEIFKYKRLLSFSPNPPVIACSCSCSSGVEFFFHRSAVSYRQTREIGPQGYDRALLCGRGRKKMEVVMAAGKSQYMVKTSSAAANYTGSLWIRRCHGVSFFSITTLYEKIRDGGGG